MDAVVDNLYNELMCLCEVRGELSPEDNTRVEARIAALQTQIDSMVITPWFARGDIGQKILDQIESLHDGFITNDTFVGNLRKLGLMPIEVEKIISDTMSESEDY